MNCSVCCGIAAMPLRRFDVEDNSLLENPVVVRWLTLNTSRAYARYGISLHVPRLRSVGAPVPRLPIRACTPGQEINRLVGRCRSTPCDPHEQIYRYIVHSAPREPPHHSRTRQKLFDRASPDLSFACWAFFVPLSAGPPLSPQTLPGLEVGAVPRVRRRRSRTSRHMHGLWPTIFLIHVAQNDDRTFAKVSSLSTLSRCRISCGREFVWCPLRLADLGRKRLNFRANETKRNVTMNLDFFIDLRLARLHPLGSSLDVGTEKTPERCEIVEEPALKWSYFSCGVMPRWSSAGG